MFVGRANQIALAQVRLVVGRLDASEGSGTDAGALVEGFTELERLAAAGRAMAAVRAAETNQWRQDGDRSPEHWLARKSGTTVGAARDALDTAKRLQSLPKTDEAVRSGKLSAQQASAISDAAAADPDAEQSLLAAAEGASLAELRGKADEVKANARSADEERARQEQIRRSRSLRSTAADGVGEIHVRGPAADIARFRS